MTTSSRDDSEKEELLRHFAEKFSRAIAELELEQGWILDLYA